jgi:hypothetical protein
VDALLSGKTLPFAEGNILIGGPGSDVIEGRGGNDVIDGDAWLDVQLRAPDPDNPGSFKLVDSMLDLAADVFARRINPGDIFIVRSIKSTGASPTDVDTAVFCDVAVNYTITLNLNGSVIVAHNADQCPQPVDPQRAANVGDGIDTLWNIEQLQFFDVTIPAPQAAITVALTANPPSPAGPGTSITWTAAASGGSGNFQYQFLSGVSGGPLTVVQDYSASPTFNWTNASALGAYVFRVNARQTGSVVAEATTSRLYYIGALSPASEVRVVADPRSPQPPGTPVLFTAAASGGSAGTYEYEYLLSANGGPFSIVKPYNTTPSFNWTDTGTAGKYFFRVNARQAGSTGPAEATMALTYDLAEPPAVPITASLSGSPASPTSAGTVLFTATATGGSGSFEYEFQGSVDGVNFVITRDYGSDPTWSWGTAPGSYFFRVNVRSAGVPGSAVSSAVVSYVITDAAASDPITASLSGSPASPTTAGTVEFTAEATGGSGSFEYEFVGSVDGVNFIITRDYSTDPNWTWGTAPGNYFFKVNVRNAGSTSAATSEVLTYTIN